MSNRLTNEELAATERNIDGSSVPDVWKATLHMLIDEVRASRAPSPSSDAGLRRAVEALAKEWEEIADAMWVRGWPEAAAADMAEQDMLRHHTEALRAALASSSSAPAARCAHCGASRETRDQHAMCSGFDASAPATGTAPDEETGGER